MNIRISVFCGGRGSSALIRELIRRPDIDLSLLINAYDDGLSTGELREFIPGMLGPSDFRKTLSYLLDLYSNQRYALSAFLEYRLPDPFSAEDLRSLKEYLANPNENTIRRLPPGLEAVMSRISRATLDELREYLLAFLTYSETQPKPFNFRDCSFGNLLFAGAFIRTGSFNAATAELSRLFGSKAKLINVTTGENRILIALKEDGEILDRESKIVSAQSESRIADLFLLGASLSDAQLDGTQGMSLEEKRAFLRQLEVPVDASEEARNALANSDIIIYGTGTQHSSLFPSYKTTGIAAAIHASAAKLKVLLVNLHEDHDIRGVSASWLLDRALYYLGDAANSKQLITHVFCGRQTNGSARALPCDLAEQQNSKGVVPITGAFENPAAPGMHSGLRTAEAIFRLYQSYKPGQTNELDIFIDLNERSLALPFLLQEFVELDWQERFQHVRLSVNRVAVPPVHTPTYLSVRSTDERSDCSEGAILSRWLREEKSRCLVSLTGDGEYRLRDVLSAIDVIENQRFGAVYGSRNQSRRQFLRALEMAYPEARMLYFISRLANLALAIWFGIRFQAIFSDPLTGFRVYRREALAPQFLDKGEVRFSSVASITRQLLKAKVEIAEIPVSYRTYRGFTNVRWRIKRGIQNVVDSLF